ncbi:IniB N-terminal domain-containing protein [Actinosynnema sp. NPDC020468]|uniref:IniB N-terminal domain-containing protein n=1 Tax=Actinosynnema sp. NPDC020468 TaxID=3154488 RepID=UPI0033D08E18
MGTSPTTLHDFVLDLLSDPTALADFQADAEGALAAAGLSDVSALDVQEVIPLVLDYAPSGSLPALDSTLVDDLPADAGTAGAISQLQAVAQQLSGGGSDVNLAAAGALSADANGLQVFGGLVGWGATDAVAGQFDAAVAGDFSSVGDVAGSLDVATHTTGQAADLAATANGTVHGAVATAGGVTGALPGTDGLTSHVFGSLDSLHGAVDGVTGGLAGHLPANLPTQLPTSLDPTGLTDQGQSAVTTPAHTAADFAADSAHHTADVAGVGSVVSNVTDVAHHADVPVVDHLGVDDLLF